MKMPLKKFVFLGNGSHDNRGCEAIVRGTMAILRRTFGDSLTARSGVFAAEDIVSLQNKNEMDPAVTSFWLSTRVRRWSREWWEDQARNRLGIPLAGCNRRILPELSGASAVLDVGGDNYSLDYGIPDNFMAMDQVVQRKRIPLVLWCASVGPFDAEPEFAPKMFKHLSQFDGLLVRESASREYLRDRGISRNVHLVADPAFVMEPVQPACSVCDSLPAEFVGVNVSPLIARTYSRLKKPAWEMTPADIEPWLKCCAEFVREVATRTGLRVVLVPHVESALENNNDHIFMQGVMERLDKVTKSAVSCLGSGLSAAELKWVIARSTIFIGARTHSTIAAMSSGVPTVSIGYSLKARGINQDVFGCLDYCIDAGTFDSHEAGRLVEKALADGERVRGEMSERLPGIKDAAWKAGNILKKILAERGVK